MSAVGRSDTRIKDAVQVMTANRLREGDVVYLAADGSWTRDLDAAALVEGAAQAAARSAEAAEAVAARLVVGPYLFAVETGETGPSPISQRERIRAAHSPTVGSTFAVPGASAPGLSTAPATVSGAR